MNDLARQLAIAPAPGSRAEKAVVALAAPAGADAAPPRGMTRLRRRRRRRERRGLHRGAAVRAARRARGAGREAPRPRRLQDRLHALHPAQRDADDREAGARGAHRGARRGPQLGRSLDALRRLDPPPRGHAVRLQRHAPGARSAPAPHGRRDAGRRVPAGPYGDRAAGQREPRASWSRIVSARAARCARASSSPPTGATRTSRGWPACAGACARTTASSTGPTGAACSRPTTARGCGSWSPTARTSSPTRTGCACCSSRRTATACPSSEADLEGAYLRDLAALPDAPDLSQRHARVQAAGQARPAERQPAGRAARAGVRRRRRARLGPAVGRRLRVGVPERGWLVEETAAALVGGGDLDAALDSYRRVHRRRLGPHHFLISDLATARPANPVERAMYRSAADRRRRVPHV